MGLTIVVSEVYTNSFLEYNGWHPKIYCTTVEQITSFLCGPKVAAVIWLSYIVVEYLSFEIQ